MHGLRKLMLGSAAAALALTALGAPAAAADTAGTLAIVNGVPGQRIDICIGSKEQRSGVPYGSYYRKDVIGTGPKVLRFYKQNNAKTCGGTKLGQKTLDIGAGDDFTVVLTKKSPKIVVFDNASPFHLGEIPPRGVDLTYPWVSWANAAEFDTNLFYTWWSPNPTFPVTPNANPLFEKGDRFVGIPGAEHIYRLWATMPEKSAEIAARGFRSKDSRRYEAILVGTVRANAKFVLINRGISAVSP